MKNPVLIIVLLLVTMGASFFIPLPKYTSLNILSTIDIPTQMPGWRSVDVSKELNLKDERYNFINNVFARIYYNGYGEQVLFLVLDAGNFHNPKVCYTSTGFKVQELQDASFDFGQKRMHTTALHMDKPQQGLYMFYWLCIDQKIQTWGGQKLAELWSTLLNKKKAGLMVRMEIPDQFRTPQQAESLAQDLLGAINKAIKPEQREFVFGK